MTSKNQAQVDSNSHSTPPNWRWGLQLWIILMLLWLLLQGGQYLLVGASVAVLAAGVGTWLAPGTVYPWNPLRFIGFCGWFLLASWQGGLDVARRAFSPSLPIDPLLHRHRISLPAGLPRTLLVAIVSLLPGTLSARLEDDGRVLCVHALSAEVLAGVAELEQRLARLFSLPLEGAEC